MRLFSRNMRPIGGTVVANRCERRRNGRKTAAQPAMERRMGGGGINQDENASLQFALSTHYFFLKLE